jgi:chromosome segregation ATPase
MVDKETHIKLQEKCNFLQRKIENEMISIEEYKTMVARCEKMKQSSESEMIAIDEYNKIRGALQGVIEDKLKYESLYRQSEESRSNAEALVIGLKGRIEQQEMELENYRKKELSYADLVQRLQSDSYTLQELNNSNNMKIEELKQELRDEREQFENTKTTLLLQLGNLQATLQNEAALNGENNSRIKKLNAALSSMKDNQERLLLESNNKLAGCNGKIQELMNVNSESKLALDKKVSQHRMQVQKVTHELIELKQANTKMKEEFREMRELQEKKIKDLKSKLKIKSDAYHQLQLDTSTMKTQLQGLQSMQLKLMDYESQMKSINELVFSDYGEYCESSKFESSGRSPHK